MSNRMQNEIFPGFRFCFFPVEKEATKLKTIGKIYPHVPKKDARHIYRL